MLRKLMPLLLLAPLAARAQEGRWDDGQWSGDDQYSWQSDTPSAGDPRDGYAPATDGWGDRDERWDDRDRRDRDRDRRDRDRWDRDRDGYPDREQAGPAMQDFRAGLDDYGRW